MNESTIRRQLRKQGWALRKDRARTRSFDHQGGYMVVDDRNWIVAGERYDVSLEALDAFLSLDELG